MLKSLVLGFVIGAVALATAAGAQETEKPNIRIVATGGTIANSPDGRMSVESVLENIPQMSEVADVSVTDVARIGSSSMTLQNWVEIAAAINKILAEEPDVDGLVVTHGSNSAEETAYFLNLVLDTDKPIVITGAQRQQNTLGEEGSRNLYDAVKVAGSPEAAGKGVLLVVNEMIHGARDVTKRISVRPETWDSGDLGALGLVDKDQVSFYREPLRKHTKESELRLGDIDEGSDFPRVDIIYSYVDADDALVKAAVEAGAKGIVMAAFPTGSPTPAQRKALDSAKEAGIMVVTSHRGGLGRIDTGREYISADNLTPQKARILLMLALANGADEQGVKDAFADY